MTLSKNNIIITEPTLEDVLGLVFVHKKTWLDTYPNKKYKIFKKDILLKDFDSEKKINKWKRRIKNNGKKKEYICVAKDREKVVGFCSISKGEKINELKTIYVLPEYQRMKIGNKLFNKAINWLGDKKNIKTLVAIYNENAIKFYKKHGFAKTTVTKSYKFPNGKIMPEMQLVFSRNK